MTCQAIVSIFTPGESSGARLPLWNAKHEHRLGPAKWGRFGLPGITTAKQAPISKVAAVEIDPRICLSENGFNAGCQFLELLDPLLRLAVIIHTDEENSGPVHGVG